MGVAFQRFSLVASLLALINAFRMRNKQVHFSMTLENVSYTSVRLNTCACTQNNKMQDRSACCRHSRQCQVGPPLYRARIGQRVVATHSLVRQALHCIERGQVNVLPPLTTGLGRLSTVQRMVRSAFTVKCRGCMDGTLYQF